MASDNGGRDTRRRPSSNNGRPRPSANGRRANSKDAAQPGAMRPASLKYSVRESKASRRQYSTSSGNYQTPTAQRFSRDSASYVSTQQSSKGKKALVIIVILLLVAAVVALALFILKENRKSEINDDLHKMDKQQLEALDSVLTGTQTFDEPFIIPVGDRLFGGA